MDIAASPRNSDEAVADSSELCPRCAAINFDEVFGWEISCDDEFDRRLIVQLHATVKQLMASECQLCRLFGAMGPREHWYYGEPMECWVFAYSYWGFLSQESQQSTRLLRILPNFTVLGVTHTQINSIHAEKGFWRTGHLANANAQSVSSWRIRPVNSASWDTNFAIEALIYCCQNHGVKCAQESKEAMRFFKVIDCQTRSVITPPPGSSYVALSYVWGKGAQNSLDLKSDSVPGLIEDSIAVTSQLNQRYLWIDKYCIDQDNEIEKRSQIRQMDLIYSNALVTIVAAAGTDCLPGVRGKSRKTQHNLKIGSHRLVSTLTHPNLLLKESKWATRGWTYQEGIMSTRRLIFTEEQVFFDCNSLHLSEALVQPIDKMHVEDESDVEPCMGTGAFPNKNPGTDPSTLQLHILDYLERELTYPLDIINALQGIFHTFAKSSWPVLNFMGVPIITPKTFFYDKPLGFGFALEEASTPGRYNDEESIKSLTSEASFVIGLSWCHYLPGNKRSGFPTWSWAASTGKPERLAPKCWQKPVGIKIWTEGNDGKVLRLPGFDTLANFLENQPLYGIIYITVETLTISCSVIISPVWRPEDLSCKYKTKLQLENVETMLCPFFPDCNDDFDFLSPDGKELSYTGLIMSHTEVLSEMTMVVLVRHMKEHAERIGLFHLGNLWVGEVPLYEDPARYLKAVKTTRRAIRIG